jgi:hypothetical protein
MGHTREAAALAKNRFAAKAGRAARERLAYSLLPSTWSYHWLCRHFLALLASDGEQHFGLTRDALASFFWRGC